MSRISSWNAAVQRCGFSILIWLITSMPKFRWMLSSRGMYWYCSAIPTILLRRPSDRICAKTRRHRRLFDDCGLEDIGKADPLEQLRASAVGNFVHEGSSAMVRNKVNAERAIPEWGLHHF